MTTTPLSPRRPWAGLFAALLAAFLVAPAFPQEDVQEEGSRPARTGRSDIDVRRFEVSATRSPIEVDGVLDEPAWETALVVDLRYEWYPGDNVSPPVETLALVTFDEDNLYVAFRARDPEPARVRAHLMDRDDIFAFVQDDHVGFTIDTFNDELRGYQFRINPLGVQVDAVFNEVTALEDFAWDAIWASAGRLSEDGYTVEVAVPFKQLRFPRTTGPQTWGFEAFRSYPREVRYRISSRFTDRAKDCVLCQENKITGFQGMTSGRNLEILPTVTAVRTDSLEDFPDGELVAGDEDVEPGLTVRWGVTPNATLNATLNPDFSQVEADTAQLDINTRFALFFPEKRPFFLEGADLYTTPIEAVFTRTVAEPDWGAKLNAKEGKNSLGAFLARDTLNNLILPSNQGSGLAFLDQDVTSGVVRYRRDVGARSALGVLYTGREADGYHNRLGGLDGFFRFTPSDTLRLQYLYSDTLYPGDLAASRDLPTGSFGGYGLDVRYDHFAAKWKGFVHYQDLSPEFRADSGFVPRVDVRTAEVQAQRLFYGEAEDWYAQMAFGARGLRTENHDGLLTDETFELFGIIEGPLQSTLDVTLSTNREFFGGTTFDLDQGRVFFQIKPSGSFLFLVATNFGDAIDVANVRKGDLFEISPGLFFRVGRHFNAEASYLLQTLDVEGGELFEANLYQTKVVYQFNVRTFAQAILQYTDVTRDVDLYLDPVEPETDDFFAQVLFSYKLNPQTVIFAGYTDSRFGLADTSLVQTDRTFFLKIGYAWLL